MYNTIRTKKLIIIQLRKNMSYSFSYKQEEYDELTKLVHLGI